MPFVSMRSLEIERTEGSSTHDRLIGVILSRQLIVVLASAHHALAPTI